MARRPGSPDMTPEQQALLRAALLTACISGATITTIMKDKAVLALGWSRRTVQDTLRTLVDDGLLFANGRTKGRAYHTTQAGASAINKLVAE